MKKLLIIACSAAIAFSSAYALAGSDLNKVKITNKSLNQNVVNAAIGSGATANTGSVNIQ